MGLCVQPFPNSPAVTLLPSTCKPFLGVRTVMGVPQGCKGTCRTCYWQQRQQDRGVDGCARCCCMPRACPCYL